MGLIAATVTKQYLIAYKNELEYKMILIKQAKFGLSDSVNELLNVGTDMDPENPMVKQLEQRKERLNLLEKKLDMQLDEYETKLKLVETGLKECDQMISSSIKG
ncbi:MAG: hypothetical protein WCG95_01995 [bacterium]